MMLQFAAAPLAKFTVSDNAIRTKTQCWTQLLSNMLNQKRWDGCEHGFWHIHVKLWGLDESRNVGISLIKLLFNSDNN